MQSAGGSQESLRALSKNLADKLEAKGLKLPLYPTPQLIERARSVMGSIDFDPTSDPVQQVLVDAVSVPTIEVNPLQEHCSNVWVAPKVPSVTTVFGSTKQLQRVSLDISRALCSLAAHRVTSCCSCYLELSCLYSFQACQAAQSYCQRF